MTVDQLRKYVSDLERHIVRARQLPPGAGSSQRKATAALVADLEASLKDWRAELAAAEAQS